MDIEKITKSIKKPWYVPAWLWNAGVNKITAAVKERLRPAAVAQVVADNEAALLRRAVKDKDPEAIAKVTRICKEVSEHTALVMDCLKDSVVTEEEEARLAFDITRIATGYITDAEVDAKVDAVAVLLRA